MSQSRLPPFAALRAFDAVGRDGGFRRAALSLGISHAIVSRHVSGLEERLGTPLLDRRTGRLTKTGEAYHRRVSAAIAELENATNAARALRGERLTICCSAGLALHWLTHRLHRFVDGASGVPVDLRSTDDEPMLEGGEADGDIRYAFDGAIARAASGLRMEELARPAIYPVAAPSLLARLDRPLADARDLVGLPLIEEQGDGEWRAWFDAQGLGSSTLRSPIARYGQAHLTIAAARAGQGVALSNDFLADDDLREGRLIRVTPTGAPFHDVALGAYVFRSLAIRWTNPALVRFRRWLRSEIAAG